MSTRSWTGVAAGGVAGLAALTGVHCLDVWLHLRTGQLIAQTGTIPYADTLSHTRAGAAWVTHEWAFELPLYLLWTVVGDGGLVLLKACLAATAAAVLVAACRMAGAGRLAAGLAVVAATLVATPRFMVRPHMVSLVLLAALLWLGLRHLQQRDRALWVAVPALALWANLHAGVVLGLGVLGAFAVEEAWRERRPGTATWVTLAGVAAILVNPHGWGVYWYPWFLLASHQAGLFQLVEMLPPAWPGPVHLLAAALGVSALALLRPGARRPGVALVLVAGVGLFLGLTRRRGALEMAVLTAPVLSLGLAAVLDAARSAPGRLLALPRVAAPATAGVGLLALVALGWRPTLAVDGASVPAGALAFADAVGLRGSLYNSHAFGAWILWEHPDRPVYFDGRNEVFADLFTETRDTPLAELTDRYGLGVAVVDYPPDAEEREVVLDFDLSEAFSADPDWALLWFDDVARLYARRTPDNAAAIARAEYLTLRPGWTDLAYLARVVAGSGRADRVDAESLRAVEQAPGSRVARMLRAEYLRLVHRHDEALAALAQVAPDAFSLGRQGAVLLQQGLNEQAAEAFAEALRLEPDNATSWSNLGLARYRAGDAAGGVEALHEAIRLDPELLAARGNLVKSLEALGATDEARAARAEQHRLEEELARAAFDRGRELLERGLADRAVAELDQAVALRPGNPNVTYLLGVALNVSGDVADAETALRTTLELSPQHRYARLELADVLRQRHREPEAVALLLAFLEDNREPHWQAVAERRLSALKRQEERP